MLPWSYKCDEYSRCVKGVVVEVGEARRQGDDAYGKLCIKCFNICPKSDSDTISDEKGNKTKFVQTFQHDRDESGRVQTDL